MATIDLSKWSWVAGVAADIGLPILGNGSRHSRPCVCNGDCWH
jgi:hypothetical protein